MAFIIHEGQLCRDMWPHSLARFPNNIDEASTLPTSRLLPGEWDDLCGRVVIAGGHFNTESGVQVLSVYPEIGSEECPPPLYIRLQGIVKQASLTLRGNWNGEVDDAVKALQSLTLIDLYPGSEDSAFARQRDGMHNLEELILTQVHGRRDGEKPARVARNGAINLSKRAFAMVKPGIVGTNLTYADDPDGEIGKMAHSWVVDHRIGTGVPNSKGHVSVVAPQAIRPGDSVAVEWSPPEYSRISQVQLRCTPGKDISQSVDGADFNLAGAWLSMREVPRAKSRATP